jgi:hypothetical protein
MDSVLLTQCFSNFLTCKTPFPGLNISRTSTSYWWRICMRHWATNRRVAGSISYWNVGIFHWHNPSGGTMALSCYSPAGYRWPVRRAGNLTIRMCRLSGNLEASTFWNPQGLSRPVMGLLLYTQCKKKCRPRVLFLVNKITLNNITLYFLRYHTSQYHKILFPLAVRATQLANHWRHNYVFTYYI